MSATPETKQKIDPSQLLREFIENGGYSPGDRLPAERELINAIELSRTTLRKGLDTLEREGVIWRHVGKGTFVGANAGSNSFLGLSELSQQVTPVQMMRARLSLEPAIAKEAAVNASAEAIIKIKTACKRTVEASTWDSYEAEDDAFHRSLAEATGNILLLSLFDHLNQVRRAVAWRRVIRKSDCPPANHSSFKEHDLIVAAIEAHDPIAAHAASRDHLSSVSNRLYGDV